MEVLLRGHCGDGGATAGGGGHGGDGGATAILARCHGGHGGACSVSYLADLSWPRLYDSRVQPKRSSRHGSSRGLKGCHPDMMSWQTQRVHNLGSLYRDVSSSL